MKITNKTSYPKISIITPSYNQGQFIEETIRSVLDQNYPNLEYIVMDGASTDNSVDIIRKYEKHLSYWVSEKDKGQTDAINKGIQRATGEIIAWLNSDDFYYPGTFDIISQAYLAHPDAGLYIGNGSLVDKDGKKMRRFSNGMAFDFHTLLKGSNYVLQQSTFINKVVFDTLGLLDESLHYTMDLEFWLRVGSKYPVVTIDEELAAYRWSDEIKTASGGLDRWVEQWHVIRRFSNDQLTIGLLVELFAVLQEKKVQDSLNIPNLDKFAKENWHFFYQAMQQLLGTRDCIPMNGKEIRFVPAKKISREDIGLPLSETAHKQIQSKMKAPGIITSRGSNPKVDIILPIGHSWFVREGYAQALKHFNCLGRIFYVHHNQAPADLYEYLKEPQADSIFLMNTDWHAQHLHDTPDWIKRWRSVKAVKLLFSFECMNNPTIKQHGNWLSDTVQAVKNAVECVDVVSFAHEIDEDLFQQYTRQTLWQPFAIDEELFPTMQNYFTRKQRAFFRGQTTQYYNDKTYQSRRNLIERLKSTPNIDVFDSYSRFEGTTIDRALEFIREMCSYQIVLGLPSLSPTMVVRPFEALASGCVFFQNKVLGERTNRVFEDFKHLIFYDENEPADLLQKINHILSNPELGKEIANNGYREVLEKHTIKKRVSEALQWISQNFQNTRGESFSSSISPALPAHPKRASIQAEEHAQSEHLLLSGNFKESGTIIVDGVVFDFHKHRPAGIYRLWASLLEELAGSPLADRILLLDRAGTAPNFPRIRRRVIKGYPFPNFEDDSLYLEDIRKEENASLFLSTYYTYPENSNCALMLYDMIPELTDMDLTGPEWRAKSKAIEKAKAHFAISQSTINDFKKLYPQYAMRNFYLTYCAVSDEFSAHTKSEIEAFKEKYIIRKPYFMLVGKRSLYKNAILFFKAFSLLENETDFEIVCTGGDLEVEREFIPYLKGANCRVVFLNNDELSLAYSGASALVYPSKHEGFGLPILEANKSGCPVITCRNSSIPEVAGNAALYVDESDVAGMRDALIEVQQPDIRETLIRKGYENVKRFSWEKTGQQLIDAIHEIINDLKDAQLNPSDPINTVGRLFYILEKRSDSTGLLAAMKELRKPHSDAETQELSKMFGYEDVISGMNPDIFSILQQSLTGSDEGEGFIYFCYGLALEQRQAFDKALDAYLTARKQSDLSNFLKWRITYSASDIAYDLGKLDLAKELLEEFLSAHPDFEGGRKRLRKIEKELQPKAAGKIELDSERAAASPAVAGKELPESEMAGKEEYLVSAIVSTYNSERFIRGCLEDLINQTLYKKGDLEIVVIDSGSEQDEDVIVREFQKKNPNIKYIKTEKRETIYAAWNRGIKAAKGGYITNANTDDRHRKDALEVMARELDENRALALVYGDQIITKSENETFDRSSPVAYFKWPEFDRHRLLHRSCIGPQPMWRRSLHDEFGYFREELKVAGDYEWWLRISAKHPFKHIHELLGLYLVNEEGLEYAEQGASQKESSAIRELYMKKAGIKPQPDLYPANFIVPKYDKASEKEKGQLVSVIIPTYNRPDMLKEAIRSVLNQTYRNFEVIVVNDSGVDVANVVAEINKEGNIRYIRHERNRGLAAARNSAIHAAKGKYIAYLDDDDIFYPDHLEVLIEFLESGEYKVAYTDTSQALQVTQQGKNITVKNNDLSFPDFDKDIILIKNLIPVLCFMHEKSCLEEVGLFDEALGTHEDWDLWIRMSRKFEIGHIRKITCEFRTRQGETQMTTSRLADFHRTREVIYERYNKYIHDKPNLIKAQKRILDEEILNIKSEKQPGRTASVIIVTYNSASTIRACLDSVLQYTPSAEVIVVDNASADETRDILVSYKDQIVPILNNENKGFSFASNQGIRASKGEYIILLNPDTVVTPMWADRMLTHFKTGVGAVGPLTNYVNTMQLSISYAKDHKSWETLNTNERAEKLYEWNKGQSNETKLLMGFCLALPRKVLDEVGLLDEDLFLGSEDLEISWRLREKGYKLIIAVDTFTYHEGQVSFKSRKTSTSDLTQESADKLYAKLEAHYGAGNVPHPMELWGIDYFKPKDARFRSLKPTFAAVYCVYDDKTWLRESIESVYDVVDALYFLISDKPWFGQATDNKTTLEYIRTFPDPRNKIKIIEGGWTNETDQRNKGLDIVREAGIAYCFVIDADEIYDPMELKRMMEFIINHPEIDCWHMTWDTYWKTYRYRIDPREPFEPVIFVKARDAHFTKNRTIVSGRHGMIPPETGICHHLSYARSDAEVLKKITTFSHAHEVQPGWFENVWKRWDADHSLTDLHPTHPHAYQKAVEQPYSALPPVLQKRYAADEKTGSDVIPGLTSIIILAHNRWDQTELCLKSIRRHTPEPHEIVIVDNGSTDETGERLQELVKIQDSSINSPLEKGDKGGCTAQNEDKTNKQPPAPPLLRGNTYPTSSLILHPSSFLRVISNIENRGFASGCNQGIAAARGEYVLLLNNDTIVTPGWLGRMTDVFKRHPKTGIVGPMSNNVTRPQLVENVGYENNDGINDFAVAWAKEHEGRSFTTYKASGFCLLAKREVIDAIGGLDERFGSGNFEDDDFCSRAFLKGFEIRIAQDVFIHHAGRQTFKSAGIDYKAKMASNWELYKNKWNIPKDTPLETYWVPSRLPDGVDLYVPLPDVSSGHTSTLGDRRWDEKEEQSKKKIRMEEKERMRGVTSIIVLLSGRREYARRCAETIEKHTKTPHEIIFIPHDPSYAPPKWLRRLLKEHPEYRVVGPRHPEAPGSQSVIPARPESFLNNPLSPPFLRGNSEGFPPSVNDKRMSYAQACNLGIRESSGEYIAILDDAALVTEEWLSGLIECLDSSADAGIVGPMTVNIEGLQGIKMEIQGSRIRGAKGPSEIEAEKGFRPSRNDKDSNPRILDPSNPEAIADYAKAFREKNRYRRVPAKNLDGFCLLFKGELTEKAGLFDEGFETDEYAAHDYCLRAAAEGYGNLIAGDVFVHYSGRVPLPALKDKIAFGKKWGGIDESKPESKKVYCANALFLANELNQKGLREKAVVTLVEGIKSYPDEKRLHYALAEMLIEAKKFKEALDVLDYMPEGMKKAVKGLELVGYCKEGLGLNEEAGQYADEVLGLNSESPRAWTLKGTIAFKKGLTADAEKYFTRALESDKGFGEAYSNLGALQWIGGNKEEAFKLFQRAFILSPDLGDIVTNYYTAAVSLSKLPGAERVFREAVALHPFNRKLKFILIDNLLQQGKFDEAMKSMEEAMEVFGIDDDTLSLALNLRDRVGAMGTNKSRESRSQGVEGSREELREKSSNTSPTTRILESSTPGTLSLCMIVKNEEKNIVRSLVSVKPLVDEMIVVDTGSSDRTKKIAKAFGAKVYDFPWTGSFSDARNFSLSKASGDWILILDADEVISASDHGKLKELVTPPSHPYLRGVIAFSFITRNYVGPVSVNWNPNDGEYKEEAGSGWFPSGKVRLFPNDSRIRFEKPVHETVEDSLLRAGYEIKKSDIPIHHYGKLDKEVIRVKGEEYYQLGKKKLVEQGVQDPHALYELAVQASELEKYEEALEFWKKLIMVKPDLAKAYYGMGTCCYQLGRYGEARAAYKKAIELDPGSKDAVVMHATSEFLSGDADSAISHIEGFLKKDPGYPLALLAATAANFCAGRKEQGLAYVKKVEQTQFDLAPYLNDIAKLLIKVKRCDYAISLLEAAVETNNVTSETRQLLDECLKKKVSLPIETERIPP